METMERTAERADERTGRRPVLVVLVAIAALLLGGLGGWMLNSSDPESDVAVVGGGELSDRQEEMLRVAEDWHDALLAGDGDRAVTYFAPSGVVDLGLREIRVDDGSLAAEVDLTTRSNRFFEPVLVFGDAAVYPASIGGTDYVSVIRFTPSGEVLIVKVTTVPTSG